MKRNTEQTKNNEINEYPKYFSFISLFFVYSVFLFIPQPQNPQPKCKGPADLEKAIASAPSADAYNALGAYFAKRGEMPCAMSAFEKALRLDPRSWETRYNRALALMQNGDWKRASRELKQLVLEKPEAVNSRNALATTLLELGHSEEAAEEFKKVLAVDA